MSIRRKCAALTVMLCALGLAGCSGLRLHDAERDRQGQAARKAWSEVDLQASIDAERANLQALLAAELDTQRTLATAIRDHELRALVRGSSVTQALVERVNARLKGLADQPAAIKSAREKLIEVRKSQDLVAAKTNDLASKGLVPPACGEAAETPPAIAQWLAQEPNPMSAATVRSALRILRRECERKLSEADVYLPFGGAIGIAWSEYALEERNLRTEKERLAVLERTYRQARDAYDKAVAASTAPAEPGAQATVNAAAEKVRSAVAALQGSSSPYAARLLAEERLQAIADLAQAITESAPGRTEPATAGKTARTVALLPGLADDVRSAIAQSRKPLALPLLIRKNFEQLNLEAAKRDIAAREEIVRLSHELVIVLYQQAQQLWLAGQELQQTSDLHGRTVVDAFSNGTTRQRETLYAAAARYLDAINRLDAKRYILEYRRVAAHHEKTLAYAEVNARQWKSLIDTSVNQVADYSAGGLKPDQIANFLNTIGLLSIGVGVNK